MAEMTSQQIQRSANEDIEYEDLLDGEDSAEVNLRWSYCANSDLFTHNLLGTPRDLPDEDYKLQVDFFRTNDFS